MSVLIKGMEMPTSCCNCPCADDECRFCRAAKEYIPMVGHPKFCPLIEIKPHGRLIDADALPLEESVPTVMMHNGERWISAYELAMAPTIIPTSEEGE